MFPSGLLPFCLRKGLPGNYYFARRIYFSSPRQPISFAFKVKEQVLMQQLSSNKCEQYVENADLVKTNEANKHIDLLTQYLELELETMRQAVTQ